MEATQEIPLRGKDGSIKLQVRKGSPGLSTSLPVGAGGGHGFSSVSAQMGILPFCCLNESGLRQSQLKFIEHLLCAKTLSGVFSLNIPNHASEGSMSIIPIVQIRKHF